MMYGLRYRLIVVSGAWGCWCGATGLVGFGYILGLGTPPPCPCYLVCSIYMGGLFISHVAYDKALMVKP